MQILAAAGSAVLCDGRLYHSGGVNFSDAERVFVGVKYVPWWLNLHCRRAGSAEALIQAEHGPQGQAGVFGGWPFIRHEVYDALPPVAQPLFAHWVDRNWIEPRL